MKKVKYSVFAPVFNEEGNLTKLYNEVKEVMDSLDGAWEFIFVNDGSTDGSLAEIRSLKNVVLVDLAKNYGQSVAMDAGFRTARGDFIITIDADLQNDPKDIPALLKKMEDEKLDVVAGWRAKRRDPFWMKIVTRCARFLRGFIVSDKIHDSGCTLRVYRRSVVEDLELWGEMHRYIIEMLVWNGAKVGELKVNHRRRNAGKTKYTWKKSFKGFVDLMYIWFWKKFSSRPLHLFGISGMFLGFLGFWCGVFSVYTKLVYGTSLSDSGWFILSLFLILMGIQFFTFGILFDLVIRNYYQGSRENRYSVKKIERLK